MPPGAPESFDVGSHGSDEDIPMTRRFLDDVYCDLSGSADTLDCAPWSFGTDTDSQVIPHGDPLSYDDIIGICNDDLRNSSFLDWRGGR